MLGQHPASFVRETSVAFMPVTRDGVTSSVPTPTKTSLITAELPFPRLISRGLIEAQTIPGRSWERGERPQGPPKVQLLESTLLADKI